MLSSEGRQGPHAPNDPIPDQNKGFPVQDQIGVVANKGAGGAQVDDAPSRRGHVPE